MTRTNYRPQIEAAAGKYGLQANLVEAQVIVESNGYADAFRFEPGFFEQYMKGKPAWAFTFENPRRYSASYGLLQPLFVVAYEMGYQDAPEGLFRIETNLEFGCRKLAALVKWAQDYQSIADNETRLRSALAAYNGGKGRNAPDSAPDRNQEYANKVFRIYQSYR